MTPPSFPRLSRRIAAAYTYRGIQAENIVEIGELGPMDIDLPGIYIDRIVPATVDKSIEIVTLRKPKNNKTGSEKKDDTASINANKEDAASDPKLTARLKREKIARRAAKELQDGYYCNLGVGMPVLAASYLEPGVKVWLQSENGILGMGEYPTEDEVDA
jgi:3-oxoacid CoA-transferase